MLPASKPRWQQVTALVSLSASGTVTGFSFVPSSPADLMSPTSMPIRLMALERSAQPAPTPSGDAALRSAIVNVARYYLRMAAGKTPAEMEAIIWQHDSIDGVDHGESCAAFASLTLELAAQVVGEQSWVTGGTSYPWPLHKWADVRVDPNSDSPNIISVLQDAEANGRWHPLGDGYQPQPGDWVLFDGHVEVVTKYAGGVLDTIGGDSLPNFSVNAHEYPAPLAEQGVVGFVNNGDLPSAVTTPSAGAGSSSTAGSASSLSAQLADSAGHAPAPATAVQPTIPGTPSADDGAQTGGQRASAAQSADTDEPVTGAASPAGRSANAAIPGTSPAAAPGQGGEAAPSAMRPHHSSSTSTRAAGQAAANYQANAAVPGTTPASPPARPQAASTGAAAIPGTPAATQRPSSSGTSARPYRRHQPTPTAAPVQDSSTQQAFIDEIVPGALATQRRYGIPAAVTIAQAIDESGWGQSTLAVQAHNLFGIKGTGPAGSDLMPTQEYENGQWVTINAPFRMYHNFAESIDDHGELLATSGYYTQAMADRNDANAFADALTGVYATNPQYGPDLIELMQEYGLYRYDAGQAPSVHNGPGGSAGAAARAKPTASPPSADPGSSGVTTPSRPRPVSTSSPGPVGRPSPGPTGSSPQPDRTPAPGTERGTSPQPDRTQAPGTGRGTSPQPGSSAWPQLPGMPSPEPSSTALPQPAADSSTGAANRSWAQLPGMPSPEPASTSPAGPRESGSAGQLSDGGSTKSTGTLAGQSRGGSARQREGASATAQPGGGSAAQPGGGSAPQPSVGVSGRATGRPASRAAWSGGAADVPGAPAPRAATSPGPNRSAGPASNPRSAGTPGTPSSSAAPGAPRPDPVVIPGPTGESEAYQILPTGMSTTLTASVRPMPRQAAASRRETPPARPETPPARPEPAPARPEPAPARPETPPARPETPPVRAETPPPSAPRPSARRPVQRPASRPYRLQLPTPVKNAFVASAKAPLMHEELLYRDVADGLGLSWELLAACDWMQCEARPRLSPVHGEKLGTRNPDGTVYRTRSEALEQCATDLVELARTVYGIDLTTEDGLSIGDLARVFAAFRWGGLLKQHRTSAMEFPYSVAGLTVQHLSMRWPAIAARAPDEPGKRFRKPFGAVPVVLSLNYPATV